MLKSGISLAQTILSFAAFSVVRVGCIIDAQPSKAIHSLSPGNEDQENLPLATSHSALYPSYRMNSLNPRSEGDYGRALPWKSGYHSSTPSSTSSTTSTTSPSTAEVLEDSCSGKGDGYYQNWSADCTSYYFCASGYQITYVCPPGKRYDGKRCEEDYKCPRKEGYNNPCGNKSNGYYAYPTGHEGRYFYCFQHAKVIELQCDSGKVFANGKCSFSPRLPNPGKVAISADVKIPSVSSNGDEDDHESCDQRPNGFYTMRNTRCGKYYYCISGEKTELSCQTDYTFNGDLCVQSANFECPS